MNIVYAKIKDTFITAIDSDVFMGDFAGWYRIDAGDGDHYLHAQGNYLPKPLMDELGRYRYKLVDGAVVERTPEELAADVLPATVPSNAERLAAVEAATDELVLLMADMIGGGAV